MATKDENVKKLAELKAKAEELAQQYNDAVQNGKFGESVKINAETEEAVNEYTSIVRTMCFDECKSKDDPMLYAVTIMRYETIAIKDEKKGEDKIPVRSIVPKERDIDLLRLDKYCGGIGKDKNWMHIVQKLNFLLTVDAAKKIGVKPAEMARLNDSYLMSEIARQFDMGKNPVSKTNLLKTLQTAVSAMIGDEYKATSHDVERLMMVFAKRGKTSLAVVAANHKNFRTYVADVCHRIVTSGDYSIIAPMKKEESSKAFTVEDKTEEKPKAAKESKVA